MDVAAVRLFVMAVAGWWANQRQASVAYLMPNRPRQLDDFRSWLIREVPATEVRRLAVTYPVSPS